MLEAILVLSLRLPTERARSAAGGRADTGAARVTCRDFENAEPEPGTRT